ncbi:hypothetical protein N7491_002078 [Penicillium cf. griseofulvum]|uniref:Sulfotransferase domain-containing protein n=1 Tax=Penicillium cf. griseofulvum TaxID=2972120 RepID=A0A9W9T2U8_9EURO|nr:hypothetical protein N7472_003739 [Penicillium cf. griseofulvum]KAJ5445996.1 hypothetical protein N7491_002078 [Penicillium cf. griseofulvum]KAJ5447738.1 hypothetical protein N7445_002559 [Penicillium cf. griseofulvum]
MSITEDNDQPHRVLLVSVPRTASNLLLKILNVPNQPKVLTNPKSGYFFYDAFISAGRNRRLEKPLEEWTTEAKNETKTAFQLGFDELEEYSTRARAENKIMFAKEHAFWFINPSFFTATDSAENPEHMKEFSVSLPERYGPSQTFSANNKTVLPDEYLRTWQIAFIIRHPALAWASMYRAMLKLTKVGFVEDNDIKGASIANLTMKWTRALFDWCLEQPGNSVAPLVIDANDLIHNPGAVVKFCEKAGLDPAFLQFEWNGSEKKSENWTPERSNMGNPREQELHKIAASIMLSTLEDSTGIVKDKAPASVDIDAEVTKWRVEFGDEPAEMLEKATRDSMPDYEYLKANSITV